MKNLIYSALFAISFYSNIVSAAPADPCRGPDVVKNSWIISINEDDAATKENLLETLNLLSTAGFSVQLSQMPNSPNKFLYVKFDVNSYWDGVQAALKEKRRVLRDLVKIPGNMLYCDKKAELHEDSSEGVIEE